MSDVYKKQLKIIEELCHIKITYHITPNNNQVTNEHNTNIIHFDKKKIGLNPGTNQNQWCRFG
jgi:hypothetical protein